MYANHSKWLSYDKVVWPSNDLLCLNSVNKSIVLKTELHRVDEATPIVPFDKFDKFSILVCVTSLVIKALIKFKCLNQRIMLNL